MLPELSGREQAARLRWVYDGQDHWIVPNRGLRFSSTFDWLFEAPDITGDLRRATLHASTFAPLGRRGRAFVSFEGGTFFRDEPSSFYQFTLGGPLRLSAFDVDEFRGDHLLLVSTGYLHTMGRLPAFVGGPVYLIGFVESGSAFDALMSARVHTDLSGGLLVETLLGPLLMGGSVGDDGSSAFFFSIGRVFK